MAVSWQLLALVMWVPFTCEFLGKEKSEMKEAPPEYLDFTGLHGGPVREI